MKYVHPEIQTVFDTENGSYNTLIVEDQRFLVRLLDDLNRQLQGLDGDAVISYRDTPLSFSKSAMLLDCFVPFELNYKPLLNQIITALSRRAIAPEQFEGTAEVLSAVELWLYKLSMDFPCDIVFSSISAMSLIKAVTPEIRREEVPIAERVLDFMELVETFDRRRLFFTLNMRSFVSDDDMELFSKTAVSHGYAVIGLESVARSMLSMEKRTIIDADLCEIG